MKWAVLHISPCDFRYVAPPFGTYGLAVITPLFHCFTVVGMPIALFRVAGKAVPVCDTGSSGVPKSTPPSCLPEVSGVPKSPFGVAGKPLSRDGWRMAVCLKVLSGQEFYAYSVDNQCVDVL